MAPNEDKHQIRAVNNSACIKIKENDIVKSDSTSTPTTSIKDGKFEPEAEDIIKINGSFEFDEIKGQWNLRGTWGYPSYPDTVPQKFTYRCPVPKTEIPNLSCENNQNDSDRESNAENQPSNVEKENENVAAVNDERQLPEVSRWTGYFSNLVSNGVKDVNKRISESFEMNILNNKTNDQFVVHAQGINQFGRFELVGILSKASRKLEGTKTYLDPVSEITEDSRKEISETKMENIKLRDIFMVPKPKVRRPRVIPESERKKAPRRCIICVNNGCDHPKECRGKGGRMYHDCQRCVASPGGMPVLERPVVKRPALCAVDRPVKKRKRNNAVTASVINALMEQSNGELIQLLNKQNKKPKETIDVQEFLKSFGKGGKCRNDLKLVFNASNHQNTDIAAAIDKKICEKIRKLTSGWNSTTGEDGSPVGLLEHMEVYKGFSKDAERNGYGICAYANGYVYEGQWLHGLMEGRGIITDPRGSIVYQGEFVKNRISGVGTFFFDNGDRFDGEWHEGFMHGYGEYDEACGKTYVGEWLKGKRHGHGKITLKDGSFYDGEWGDDKPHGRGYLHIVNVFTYDGLFKHGQMDGRGQCWWNDGGCYEGNFHSNLRDGRGTYTFPNLAVFEGRFRNDQMEGNGLLRMEEDKPIALDDDQIVIPVNYK
uniref:MORN repeat-containing protein 5 n=1 Tax=Aplanochytrium stocchinoi TaxID=215587 RepID=A0A7S3PET0_9STRA|mmetsp:Transcript_107/g.182  ORF Transcript_107/g.182 Transcript_107/m.182 type:complete len:656 (+) Transcript_107:704-2671(+)|eukprot:CAMPEP_0204844076 /NCGR_PEP_ID=MMETSP1346-20131115/48353_1 /ASSEMBLY_ACC=CAM_ASM_000771 /TAXON_ID=215587 /ORGANISM="Aplanochytrium stocchinoi, Strain GSBS06" /LENGTH=655 /DNA_ID=CAMNT_0051983329 /DNA_START=639 /DNA_END=2609 /DNA_ORIENTATION=+